MRIRMLESRLGVANAVGSRTQLYRAGEAYSMSEAWQRALAGVFVEAGWAELQEAAAKPRRASSRRSKRSL